MKNSEIIKLISKNLSLINEGLFEYADLTKKFDITINFIQSGAKISTHNHDQTVFNLVLEGSFKMTDQIETKTYSNGDWLRIEKNVEHSVEALTEVILLELWEK